jgi:2'-hydroxyisoflavone reductase
MPSRRDFLKSTAVAGGALLGGLTPRLARAAQMITTPTRARAGLDVLVLGGTGFIGPHLVRHAISRGHRVTIFTRGQHEADLPESVIHLQGDRNGQLGALAGKRWDAVVDDSATDPDWVRQSTELLRDAVGMYMFTSSTGVFFPYLKRGLDEYTPPRLEDEPPGAGGRLSYGVSKARCERQTQQVFGDRAVIIRPSFIVGPGDTTDRFPYWPVRLARGGEVLAPGRHDDPVQFIDVRDLTEWMVRLLEQKRGGVFNAAGPRSTMNVTTFLEQARTAINPSVKYTWVDDYDFLAEHRITDSIPWALLKGNNDGLMSIRNDRAVAAGLTFRPLAPTIRDTLAWWPSVPEERRTKPHFSITPEKEAEALAAWHARKG